MWLVLSPLRGSTSFSLTPWPSPPPEWGRGELSSHFILTVLTYLFQICWGPDSAADQSACYHLCWEHFLISWAISSWVGTRWASRSLYFCCDWHIYFRHVEASAGTMDYNLSHVVTPMSWKDGCAPVAGVDVTSPCVSSSFYLVPSSGAVTIPFYKPWNV